MSEPSSTSALPLLPLLWMSPLLAGGGYASEALTFASGLARLLQPRAFALRQFAEQADESYTAGIPRTLRGALCCVVASRHRLSHLRA